MTLQSSTISRCTYAVHAVAFVRRGHSLALKHVTQVTTTSPTKNLNTSHTECRIGLGGHSALVAFVERRPATARLELRLG
jgi:hypothetical protein